MWLALNNSVGWQEIETPSLDTGIGPGAFDKEGCLARRKTLSVGLGLKANMTF